MKNKTFSFRMYFDGYESPRHEFEIEEHELEGMTEEEREEYIAEQITGFVKDSLEIIEIKELR